MALILSIFLPTILGIQFNSFVLGNPEERHVGVKVGDWMRYGDINVTWSSTDPTAQPPPKVDWTKFIVQNVSGTNITWQWMVHYGNGTEQTEVYWTDVNTGEGNITSFFVSAGLNPGDSIYTSVHRDLKINETISRIYVGVPRETNHLIATFKQPHYNESDSIYWDRATGVLTEIKSEITEIKQDYVTSKLIYFKITDTNLWGTKSFLIEDYFPYWKFSKGEKWFPTSFYFDNDAEVQNNTLNYDNGVGAWDESFVYIHMSNTSESYLLIEYWLYYTWNDNHIWDGWDHKHDWDSTVVIAFDKNQDYAPSGVYFFHHGLKPYLPWDSPILEKKDGTHIVTYVANGTHGAYTSKYMFPDDWSEGGEEYGPKDFNWIIAKEEVDQLDGDGDDHQFCLLEHWTIGTEQFEPNGRYWPHHYYDEDEEGAADPAPWHRKDWNNLTVSSERYLALVAESPVYLFLTDPQGRRVGFDFNTKTVINEIPGSMYTGTQTEKQAIWIPNILDGKYEVKLIGIGEGSYSLTVGVSNASGIATRTFNGTVSTDQILTSIITVSSTDWDISSPSHTSIISLDRLIIVSAFIVVGMVIAIVLIRKRSSIRFKTTHKTKSVDEPSDRRIFRTFQCSRTVFLRLLLA